MNTRLLLAPATALMLLASPVMAATQAPPEAGINTQAGNAPNATAKPAESGASTVKTAMQRCNLLESRFDGSVGHYRESLSLTRARALGDEGKRFCASGNAKAGVIYLEQALDILHYAPKA